MLCKGWPWTWTFCSLLGCIELTLHIFCEIFSITNDDDTTRHSRADKHDRTMMHPAGQAFDSNHLQAFTPFLKEVLSKVKLNQVLFFHSVICIVLGTLLVLSPHRFVGSLITSKYSQFTHEMIRCYGALTVAQSWLTYRCREISDYRVRKILCECYFGTYLLHFLALFRAQVTTPTSHGLTGWLLIFTSFVLCSLYGYFRFAVKIKAYQLPTKMDL